MLIIVVRSVRAAPSADNVIGGRLFSREMRQISVRAGRAGMFLEDPEQEGGGVKKVESLTATSCSMVRKSLSGAFRR